MDPGLAAVFGAAVGVIGSALTGALTWAASRAQMRTQLQADHLRWKREVRRETYLGLLNSVRAARGALAASLDELNVSLEDGQRSTAEAWRVLAPVESAAAAVQLEGPTEMAAPATDLAKALFSVFKAAYPWREGSALDDPDLIAAYRRACSAFESVEKGFVASAQRCLDIGAG
ncbi:hypothetical protein ACIBAG_31660 [Streptomyces sp. NPDC051243]|uniref:hypothetical protein n=1 Tax=Streptomyces sp. NPDC051243 TaxID=3365646 RepID=UPI0037B40F58